MQSWSLRPAQVLRLPRAAHLRNSGKSDDDDDDNDDNHLGLPGPGQQTRAQEVRQHHTWRGVRVGEHTSIFQSKSFLIKPSFILTPCDHYQAGDVVLLQPGERDDEHQHRAADGVRGAGERY